MRELVYLSQAKLQQFRKPASRKDGLGRGLKLGAAGVGLPSAELGLNYDPAAAAAAGIATLDEAEKFIRGKWPVRWWTEPQTPGEWIQFELPLAFGVLEGRPGRQALLFWGADAGGAELLLHASPHHLVAGYASDAPTVHVLPSYVSGLFTLFDELDRESEHGRDVARMDRHLTRVIRKLRNLAPDFTAGWLSGMARASFDVTLKDARRIVVASPLFVEHIPAPR